MARIKSAWELALERTSDIKSDKDSVRANELKRQGQKIASEYINSSNPEVKDINEALKSYSKNEQREVRKSVLDVLLSQVSLPRDRQFKEKLEATKNGLAALSKNSKKVSGIIDQIAQFFDQYLQYQQQITDQLKQQYEPQLRQKKEQLSRQYGYSVDLKPEQDPEFNQLLKKNLQQLEEQYQQALTKAREELRSFIDW